MKRAGVPYATKMTVLIRDSPSYTIAPKVSFRIDTNAIFLPEIQILMDSIGWDMKSSVPSWVAHAAQPTTGRILPRNWSKGVMLALILQPRLIYQTDNTRKTQPGLSELFVQSSVHLGSQASELLPNQLLRFSICRGQSPIRGLSRQIWQGERPEMAACMNINEVRWVHDYSVAWTEMLRQWTPNQCTGHGCIIYMLMIRLV